MWVNPFLCGVIATILVEVILIFLYAIFSAGKKK